MANGPIGSAGMYRLKPYYDTDAPVELPECVYKMNSIYNTKQKTGTSGNQSSIQVSTYRQVTNVVNVEVGSVRLTQFPLVMLDIFLLSVHLIEGKAAYMASDLA